VANRFYYQANIPVKDAGGIESWVRLGEAVELPATQLWSMQHVLPSVRFAVDASVSFARRSTLSHDAQYVLRIALEHFRSRAAQTRALEILRFELDLLWSILDALHLRYGREGV
jgi:pyrroloquinoline-quinone synthase